LTRKETFTDKQLIKILSFSISKEVHVTFCCSPLTMCWMKS
jgi:hypothetical protein